MKFALQTIDKMAEKCAQHIDSCYGVGVLNEPQPGSPTPLPSYLHAYLLGYYAHAIMTARKHLDAEVPVVLYSWVNDFDLWYNKQYPQSKYGNVIWDTHLYTENADSVDEALSMYDADLLKILKF